MITTHASDPVATFNADLAYAKLRALRLLQDLMVSLTDPAAPAGGAIREVRLAACAILRAQPMKAATEPPAARPHAPTPPTAPQPPDSHIPPPPAPRPRIGLDPLRRRVANDIRRLIREGNPDMIREIMRQRTFNGPPVPPPPPAGEVSDKRSESDGGRREWSEPARPPPRAREA